MSEFVVSEEGREELARYIKKNREEREIGLNQLALKAGIQKTILSRLESGKILKINPFFLKQIAEALNKDYKELYKIVGYLDEDISDTSTNAFHKDEKGNVKLLDHKIVELPVYGRASAGDGYINLENQISTKRVIANGFSPESFIVEVTGDSMSNQINDGDWAVVDPQQRDYLENKVYVVTYEGETFIKQIVCPAKGMVVLKSFNGKYEDKYVMKDSLAQLKVEGRVVKVISEKRF